MLGSTNIHEEISCVVGRKDTRTAALLLGSSVSPLTESVRSVLSKAAWCWAPAAIRCEKPSRQFLVEPECHREPAGQWVRLSLAAREAQPCIKRLLRNSSDRVLALAEHRKVELEVSGRETQVSKLQFEVEKGCHRK